MQAVPITDIVKNSISSADIVTDPIIGTSLVIAMENVTRNKIMYVSYISTCEYLIGVLICNVYVHAYAASLFHMN